MSIGLCREVNVMDGWKWLLYLLVIEKSSKTHTKPLYCWNSARRLMPKQKIPAKFNTISATINTIYQQYTFQDAHTYLVLQIIIVCILAPLLPSGPVYTRQTLYFFGFTKLFDLNLETHFKTARRKGVRIPSMNDTICGSQPSPQIIDRLLFRGLHSCRK